MSSPEVDEGQAEAALQAVSAISALFGPSTASGAAKVYCLDEEEYEDEEEGDGRRTLRNRRGVKRKIIPVEGADDDDDETESEQTKRRRNTDKHIKCMVSTCTNNTTEISAWKSRICRTHSQPKGICECRCNQPYMLFLLQRPSIALACLYAELVLDESKIEELALLKAMPNSWRVCSDHFHPDMINQRSAFPFLGLNKTRSMIQSIVTRYGLSSMLPPDFSTMSLDLIRVQPCFRLVRDVGGPKIVGMKYARLPFECTAGTELAAVADFYSSSMSSKNRDDMPSLSVASPEPPTETSPSSSSSTHRSPSERPSTSSNLSPRDANTSITMWGSSSLRRKEIEEMIGEDRKRGNSDGGGTIGDSPRHGSADAPPNLPCKVAFCKNTCGASSRNLPLNVQLGIEWITICQQDPYQQNYWIQRYVEGAYVAFRSGDESEWTKELTFRVCNRHFASEESDKPNKFMPSRLNSVKLQTVESIRRRDFYYMYGIKIDVPVHKDAIAQVESVNKNPTTKMTCCIPNCTVTGGTTNPVKGEKYRVFPSPYNYIIRKLWLESIRGSALVPAAFTMPAMSVICERHFTNGGRAPDGLPELPTEHLGRPNPQRRPITLEYQLRVFNSGKRRSGGGTAACTATITNTGATSAATATAAIACPSKQGATPRTIFKPVSPSVLASLRPPTSSASPIRQPSSSLTATKTTVSPQVVKEPVKELQKKDMEKSIDDKKIEEDTADREPEDGSEDTVEDDMEDAAEPPRLDACEDIESPTAPPVLSSCVEDTSSTTTTVTSPPTKPPPLIDNESISRSSSLSSKSTHDASFPTLMGGRPVTLVPADRAARSVAKFCQVRCCPVTSLSRKAGGRGSGYTLFAVPDGKQDEWFDVLLAADLQFKRPTQPGPYHICERHFAQSITQSVTPPSIKLNPVEAAQFGANSMAPIINALSGLPDRRKCCQEVAQLQALLSNLNLRMNTLIQYATRLCTLSGLKEVIPAEFDDQLDDLRVYGGQPAPKHIMKTLRTVKQMAAETRAEIDRVQQEYGSNLVEEIDSDDAMLQANNDLLQQLLGGAKAGQVDGEIVDESMGAHEDVGDEEGDKESHGEDEQEEEDEEEEEEEEVEKYDGDDGEKEDMEDEDNEDDGPPVLMSQDLESSEE